jgi:hypothetical protein
VPLTFEGDAPDLLVRGELPKGLAGMLYRRLFATQSAHRTMTDMTRADDL